MDAQRRIESVLVATDLAEGSDDVLRSGAALAAVVGAKLHVLHAVELPLLAYGAAGDEAAESSERIAGARAALHERTRSALPRAAEPASVEVVVGRAHDAILRRAGEVGASVVVLAPHRLRPFGHHRLGSTADRVIRSTSVPCLLVRRPLDLPLTRVVAAVDLSPRSGATLREAALWSTTLGARTEDGAPPAELELLHVVPRAYDPAGLPDEADPTAPQVETLFAAALRGIESAAAIRERVRWSDVPADEIVRATEREGADLLVVGTHGQGGGPRALLGSVASAIARSAPCPVLLVPPTPAPPHAGRELAGPAEIPVREIMRTEVVSVGPEVSLRDLVRILADHRIGGAPVLDAEGTLVGVVTATDVMRLASEAAEPPLDELLAPYLTSLSGTPSEGMLDFFRADAWGDAASLAPSGGGGAESIPEYEEYTVADVMRAAACTVEPEDTVGSLARRMLAARVHRAPVLAEGRVVGIVTTFDVLRAVAGLPRSASREGQP